MSRKPNDVDYYRVHLNRLLRKAQKNDIAITLDQGIISFSNLHENTEFDINTVYKWTSVDINNYVH